MKRWCGNSVVNNDKKVCVCGGGGVEGIKGGELARDEVGWVSREAYSIKPIKVKTQALTGMIITVAR